MAQHPMPTWTLIHTCQRADAHSTEPSTAGSCSTFGQELKGPLDVRRLWQGALYQLLPPSRWGSEADTVGHKGPAWAWSRSRQ